VDVRQTWLQVHTLSDHRPNCRSLHHTALRHTHAANFKHPWTVTASNRPPLLYFKSTANPYSSPPHTPKLLTFLLLLTPLTSVAATITTSPSMSSPSLSRARSPGGPGFGGSDFLPAGCCFWLGCPGFVDEGAEGSGVFPPTDRRVVGLALAGGGDQRGLEEWLLPPGGAGR
jgi:hypothetical protein